MKGENEDKEIMRIGEKSRGGGKQKDEVEIEYTG